MRTLALGLVLLVAFIVVAPTLRAYVTQREQSRQVEAQLAAVEASVESLEDELERWEDDAFLRAQARERLNFVLPGEALFRVIDPHTVVDPDVTGPGLSGLTTSVDSSPAVPWYLLLWESVLDAAEPTSDPVSVGGAIAAPEASAAGEDVALGQR